MTTYTATRAGAGKQPAASGWSQAVQTAWGTIEVSSNPAPADIFVMCKLPKGAVVLGGRALGERLGSGTSAGSISYTFNVGVDGTFKVPDGTSYGAATASNALGTFTGVDYAAVTGLRFESGLHMQLGGLLYTQGPFTLSEDQNAIITFQTSTTSFITGTLSLEVDYYMGVHV